MKKNTKLVLGIAAAAAVGAAIVYATRRYKSNRRSQIVADEGYEFAHDILFPGKKRRGAKSDPGMIYPM